MSLSMADPRAGSLRIDWRATGRRSLLDDRVSSSAGKSKALGKLHLGHGIGNGFRAAGFPTFEQDREVPTQRSVFSLPPGRTEKAQKTQASAW
jgi:hypothetical protein